MKPTETNNQPLIKACPDRMLTTEEAAKFLHKSASWLEKDRQTGKYGIPFHKIGHNVRYKAQDLTDFLNRSRRQFWRPDDEPYV